MDVKDGSLENKADIQLYGKNGTDAQIWVISHDEKGYMVIKNSGSGKILEIKEGKIEESGRIWQNEENGTVEQKWIGEKDVNGNIKIMVASDPDLCVDVYGGIAYDGNVIQLYDSNDSPAQRWKFSNHKLVECNKNLQKNKIINSEIQLWTPEVSVARKLL